MVYSQQDRIAEGKAQWCTHSPYCEHSWSGWDSDLALRLNVRLYKTCINLLPFLSPTLPPSVLIECFTLSWVGSEWDLKMEASWKWVSCWILETWEIVQVFNSARKKCFHHFTEAWGIYQDAWYWISIVLVIAGINCIHFTIHITCDRFKRLKWIPPIYWLEVDRFQVYLNILCWKRVWWYAWKCTWKIVQNCI